MDEASRLDRIVGDLQVAIVAAVRSAAIRVGAMVAGLEVLYDDAADILEELARPLGADAMDAVLAGLDAGMAGGVTGGVSGELTAVVAPPEPPAASQATGGPFRDADECAAAVVAWASGHLMADPDARTTSADFAGAWQAADGRSLVGYGSIIEAIRSWAQVAGVEIGRFRVAGGRGLTGLRLAAPTVDDTPPEDDTAADVTPPEDVISIVAEPVQRRPPNGGTWQSFADLGDAAAADTGGWFET